jgi:hypothetical protein
VVGTFAVLGNGVDYGHSLAAAASLVVERSSLVGERSSVVVDADKLAKQQKRYVGREARAMSPDAAAKAVPSCTPSFAQEEGHIVAVEMEVDCPQALLLHRRSLERAIEQP